MTGEPNSGVPTREPRKIPRVIILLAGIILGQVILYGPSLCGKKILLPLYALQRPGTYLPVNSSTTNFTPSEASDLIFQFEPSRRFAVSELRAGRFPTWTTYQYGGSPFIWQKFSPFLALECCTASPIILAWAQMFAALVAGVGAYLFFRRALRISFWPAVLCSWCYPMTGFFISWQGFPIGLPAHWLPWSLLAVNKTVCNPRSLAPVGLALVTCLVLICGQLDVAGQVLLVSGLYAGWCIFDVWRKQWFGHQARRVAIALGVCWILGFSLAAPAILPTYEYTKTGARMLRRSAGDEERPPAGLISLPQIVFPDIYGIHTRLVPGSIFESSAAAYTGVLATLFLAPLAWFNLRHRRTNWFWLGLAVFGLSWCLNVPGVVSLLRLPGLNMMSHNRLTFAASFALLTLSAGGLEAFASVTIPWHRWFWAPCGLLLAICLWACARTIFLPEPIDTQIFQLLLPGGTTTSWNWIRSYEDIAQLQAWFRERYATAAISCILGAIGWLVLWFQKPRTGHLWPILGGLMIAELLWFAYGRNSQSDPSLYYPKIPALEEITKAKAGRIIGYSCLPANLAEMCGLNDIRGYDAVDPNRMIELMDIAAAPDSVKYSYARTQSMMPKLSFTPEGDARLSPVLDMLGVRYVIFRRTPPPHPPAPVVRPAFQSPDYWVLENPSALPRAFVPKRVELIPDKAARLKNLGSPEFAPGEVAYVERPVQLPALCEGSVEITEDIPTKVTLALKMETPGMVVLADLWDKGWHAYLNGKQAPILVANHAVRGVIVPAGTGRLEFRYEPASFALGLKLAGGAAMLLMGFSIFIFWKQATTAASGEA